MKLNELEIGLLIQGDGDIYECISIDVGVSYQFLELEKKSTITLTYKDLQAEYALDDVDIIGFKENYPEYYL